MTDPVPNERVRTIFNASVEALKAVVREHRVTQDELHVAGDFLNRLGQAGFCRSLLDVALAMTSVDATARIEGGTRPNLEGPFHKAAAPVREDGNLFETPPPPGSPILLLHGRILDSETGEPVPGALLDVWQADHEGHYDRTGNHLTGIIQPDAEGCYSLRTAVPKDYSDHDHDPIGELFRAMGRHNRRAAHVHVKVHVGGETLLTTQLFIPGNPYLDSDYVEGAVSDDLILDMRPAADGTPDLFEARYDFTVHAPGMAVPA